jgi:hypothetical protein
VSAARRRQVERAGVLASEAVLDPAGGGGQDVVGRDGGADDEVDVFGGDAGVFEGGPRGLHRQVACGLVRLGEVAFLHAGALGDPLVVGLDEVGEVFVGHYPLGDVMAGSEQGGAGGAGHSSAPPAFATASTIMRLTWRRAQVAAA